MITGSKKHFEQRMRQRGYTWSQVEPCVISSDGDLITVDETHPAYPRPRTGLGDIVKAGLSAVGITEERVSKILGRPCGCGARADALNRWGRKLGIGGKPGDSA